MTDSAYLDHAASTPLRPEGRAALTRWLNESGNASSTHARGRALRVAVEEARETVAAALGALPHEIVFTSGGTEADNLAIKGIVWAGLERGRRHLVTTAVEHVAVLDAARWIAAHEQLELTIVPPQPDGTIDPERVASAARDDTALVSVMAANNELGSVNDVAAIGAMLRERGTPFHTDAVQAFGTLDVSVEQWQVDALALSAHKIGGPQGVGIAYLRRGVAVVPLAHGGGQDRGVRSGTFAAALDAACGAAVERAVGDRAGLRERLGGLSSHLRSGLEVVEGIRINGPVDPTRRLASHVHVSLDGVEPDALGLALDQAGIAVSAGAACGAGAVKPSHVLEACGIDGDAALRLSLGWTSTRADVDRALDMLTDLVPRLRAGEPVLA